MIAASLKRIDPSCEVTTITYFPRSDDRGLIEAKYQPLPLLLLGAFRDQMIAASLKQTAPERDSETLAGFPRSDDRGLIEATWGALVNTILTTFRDQMIAASLKQTWNVCRWHNAILSAIR